MVVKAELEKLGLHYIVVELGEAEIMENISAEQHDQFKVALLKSGLELLDDKKSVLIQKIKNEAKNKKNPTTFHDFSCNISINPKNKKNKKNKNSRRALSNREPTFNLKR